MLGVARRLCLRSFVVCAGALSLGCENATSPSGPPLIHFPRVSQDLGEISIAPQGRDVEFSFVNRGLSPLHVSRLVTSCGCVDAVARPATVAPGGTGTIAVRIAPAESEEKRASVAVHSDDASNPVAHISLSWRAVAPLDIDPVLLEFGSVRPGVAVERTVKLNRQATTVSELPCSVSRVECSPAGAIRCKLEDRLVGGPASATQLLRVTLMPGDESGYQRGTIQLHLNQCWRPNLSVSVQWRVQDVIEAAPNSLSLGVGKPAETCSRKVVISSIAGTTLAIDRIELHDADAGAHLELLQHGKDRFLAEISWEFPETLGPYRNELLIYCRQPETRILVVPVSAVVLSPVKAGVIQ